MKKLCHQHELIFLQCACKFTEENQDVHDEENASKRLEIKQLIKDLKKVNPFVEGNIFKSVENVNLKTIIAYKDALFSYEHINNKVIFQYEKLNQKFVNQRFEQEYSIFLNYQ